ncbi:MAG: hypothetical protein Q8N47_18950 [Bryobacterales bacterium]|nr:hypothetical protein [Bryobacterales bacterium]
MIRQFVVWTIALLMIAPAGTAVLSAQRKPPVWQAPANPPPKKGPRARAIIYFAGGLGLFVGGALLNKSADRYQKEEPVCIYFAGCFASTVRITNRSRQVGGAAMMAGGGVLAVLGIRELNR